MMDTDARALVRDLGRGRARGCAPADVAHLRAQGTARAGPHDRSQPALLRPRHRVVAPHPGAHERRRVARGRAAHPRARGRARRRPRARSPSSKRASTRCSARPSSGSKPRTVSTGASSSPSAVPSSPVSSTAVTGNAQSERDSHGSRPEPVHPQDARGVAAAQALARDAGNTEITPEHLLRALLDQSEGIVSGVLERIGIDVAPGAPPRRRSAGEAAAGQRRDGARRAVRREHVPRPRERRRRARHA